jgi:hypothetical protein
MTVAHRLLTPKQHRAVAVAVGMAGSGVIQLERVVTVGLAVELDSIRAAPYTVATLTKALMPALKFSVMPAAMTQQTRHQVVVVELAVRVLAQLQGPATAHPAAMAVLESYSQFPAHPFITLPAVAVAPWALRPGKVALQLAVTVAPALRFTELMECPEQALAVVGQVGTTVRGVREETAGRA